MYSLGIPAEVLGFEKTFPVGWSEVFVWVGCGVGVGVGCGVGAGVTTGSPVVVCGLDP